MKDLLKKYRIWVALIAYVIIFGCLLYFVTSYLVGRIQVANNEIQSQELSQQGKRSQINNIPKMQQQYDDIAYRKDQLDAMLLNKIDAVKLIEKMEELALQANVGIKIEVQENQIDPKLKTPPATKAGADAPPLVADFLPSKNYLKFTLNLTGDYNNIVEYLLKIENMPYYSDVISLDIKKNESKETTPVVSSSTLDPFGNVINGNKILVSKMKAPSQGGGLLGTLAVVFYLR